MAGDTRSPGVLGILHLYPMGGLALKAYFILNGVRKLEQNAEKLSSATHIICSMDMNTRHVRDVVGTHPRLYCYFNADSVPTYGTGVYNRLRDELMPRTYNPAIHDGIYTNAPLLKPTLGLADDYAHFAIGHASDAHFDGIYFDQAWVHKPGRFVLMENGHYITDRTQEWANNQVRYRWRAYIEMLTRIVADEYVPMILNCAGMPPITGEDIIPCAEADPHGDPFHAMCKLVESLDQSSVGILWTPDVFPNVKSVDGYVIEGRYLPDPA